MIEQLEEIFDLVPAVSVTDNIPTVIQTTEPEIDQQDESDKKLARDILRRTAEKSEEMLDSLIDIANGTEHPRAFEVAANLVKTLTDVVGKLDEVATRKENRVAAAKNQPAQVGVNHNHLYVGSSEDLFKMIREQTSSKTQGSIIENNS